MEGQGASDASRLVGHLDHVQAPHMAGSGVWTRAAGRGVVAGWRMAGVRRRVFKKAWHGGMASRRPGLDGSLRIWQDAAGLGHWGTGVLSSAQPAFSRKCGLP